MGMFDVHPSFSLADSVHLFAWAGVDRPYTLNGPQFLADRLSGETLMPRNDKLPVPTGAGLGLALDTRTSGCRSTIDNRMEAGAALIHRDRCKR